MQSCMLWCDVCVPMCAATSIISRANQAWTKWILRRKPLYCKTASEWLNAIVVWWILTWKAAEGKRAQLNACIFARFIWEKVVLCINVNAMIYDVFLCDDERNMKAIGSWNLIFTGYRRFFFWWRAQGSDLRQFNNLHHRVLHRDHFQPWTSVP